MSRRPRHANRARRVAENIDFRASVPVALPRRDWVFKVKNIRRAADTALGAAVSEDLPNSGVSPRRIASKGAKVASVGIGPAQKSSRTSLHCSMSPVTPHRPVAGRRGRPWQAVASWYSARAAKLGEQIGKFERAMNSPFVSSAR